jgi:hypothetical protein
LIPDTSVRFSLGDLVAHSEVEEDEFTPKSPISMPYIPDELNDPTAYPATLAAFNEAHVKYKAKLSISPTPIPLPFSGLQLPIAHAY